MKKLTTTLGLFAAGVGIAAAFAMSPAPKKAVAKTSATDYHWFSLGSGAYLGYDSDVNKQAQCGNPQTMNCVLGATDITEDEEPAGDQITLRGNKQL